MNKKIILTVVALLATVLLPLQAATDYGIRIGSTYINSDNNNNVTGDGISTRANGKIAYDPTTNVLTLKGAYVDCLGKYNGINISASVKNGLRIVIEDDNYFYNINGMAVVLTRPTNASNSSPNFSFEGSGTLAFPKGKGSIGTYSQAHLRIGAATAGSDGGCTIIADAIYSGQDSNGKRGGTLTVTDGFVDLRGFSYGALYGYDAVNLKSSGMSFSMPANASYDKTNQYAVDADGKKVTGRLQLGWTGYGVIVGGTYVHYKNKSNIKGLGITAGTVSYNSGSKTLTLDNATIDIRPRMLWTEALVSTNDKLIVIANGNCTITRGTASLGQEALPTILSSGNLSIYGPGNLTIENYNAYGIQIGEGKDLSFSNTESLKITTDEGIDLNSGALTVRNASVDVYRVKHINDLKLVGSELTGGQLWDPDMKMIRQWNITNNDAHSIHFKKVSQSYGMSIGGHELNDVNMANGFRYYNTKGTITASVGTNGDLRLLMNNFEADGNKKFNVVVVFPSCPYSNIYFNLAEGSTNKLVNPNGVCFNSYKNVTFHGKGQLVIDGSIYADDKSDLTFTEGAKVEATDLRGYDGNVLFEDCEVRLRGYDVAGYATIRGFTTVTLDEHTAFVDYDDLHTPLNLTYDTSAMKLVDANGKGYEDKLAVKTAEPYGLTVNEISVHSFNCTDIPFDEGEKRSGTVSYDPKTKTLTLDNLDVTYLTIEEKSNRDTLHIKLVGKTHVDGNFYIQSHPYREHQLTMTIIEGDGPGDRSALECSRVISRSAEMRVQDCAVNAVRMYHLKPNAGTSATSLQIIKSHVKLSGTSFATDYTLGGYLTFMLTDCEVVKPTDWMWTKPYSIDEYCLTDMTGYPSMEVEIIPVIEGDVNRDGQVGIGDIVAITNVMAGTEADADARSRADLNGDGEVGIGDIVAVTNIMAGN